MTTSEILFLVIAASLYLAVISAFFFKLKHNLINNIFLPSALFSHLISAGIRWAEAGHPPINGTYEAALAGSWFLALCAFLAVRRQREIAQLIPWTALFALLHLAYGLAFNTRHVPLTISEQSIWVDLHALFAWLAYGEFHISFFLSVVLILKGREEILFPGWFKDLPSPDILDELVFKYIVFGFIFHTLMFALGSYYSSILYGKWWTWDPVDTLFLISWLVFGIIIHMRLFYGWKRERMARLVLIGMATIMIGYWSLIYTPWATYHIFDIDLKMHG